MFANGFRAATVALLLGLIWVGCWAILPAAAQDGAGDPAAGAYQANGGGANWRPPGQIPRDAAGASDPIRPYTPLPHTPIARVTKGPGTLPNDAGQEWRDYDISPYTLRVTSTNKPEHAIIDWILLDTGYETWHGDPLGLLMPNQRTLSVYHTPKIQAVVQEMVDRFVNSEAESHAFGLRVLTVGSPNWRSKAHPMLHPVPAQSQGVQAWLLAKEDASLVLADGAADPFSRTQHAPPDGQQRTIDGRLGHPDPQLHQAARSSGSSRSTAPPPGTTPAATTRPARDPPASPAAPRAVRPSCPRGSNRRPPGTSSTRPPRPRRSRALPRARRATASCWSPPACRGSRPWPPAPRRDPRPRRARDPGLASRRSSGFR